MSQGGTRSDEGTLAVMAVAGAFDVVVVHTIDRRARNVGVQRQALQHLGDAHVGFVSVAESIDFTTPAGRMLLNMIGGVSEFFSDQLAVHVQKGVRERAEQGLHVGPVPFGFEAREPGAAATPVERQAEAVRDAFARRAAGAPYSSIAAWLNDQGLMTRKGRAFGEYAVRDLLKNRFYLGVVNHLGTEYVGQHEAIVGEELFQRVAALRVRREPRRRSRGGGPASSEAGFIVGTAARRSGRKATTRASRSIASASRNTAQPQSDPPRPRRSMRRSRRSWSRSSCRPGGGI